MTHEPRRDELLDLALGLLEPEQARDLEAHAAGCAACRAELAALRQTRRLLADLPPVEAPGRGAPVLAAARQAAAQAGAGRRPRRAAPRWLWGGALGLAGAAALALLVVRVAGPPARGPLSEDREALLGRDATPPAASPPAASPAAPPEAQAPATAATADAPRPRRAPPPGPARPAPQAPQAVVAGEAAGERKEAPEAAKSAAPALRAGRAAAPEARAVPAPPPRPAPGVAGPAAQDAGEAPCRLEQLRRLTRDAAGRVVGRLRQGRYPAEGGEVSLTVEERYGPDGRLQGATVRAGDRLITVSDADVAAGRLEPLRGVVLAATAAEAEGAAPRCAP